MLGVGLRPIIKAVVSITFASAVTLLAAISFLLLAE